MPNKYDIATVFKARDKITAPLRKMQSKTKKFTRSLERGFNRVNNRITKIQNGLAKGALILGAAFASVGFAIKKVTDRADELSKQAKVLDMPIEDLQEWQFAAEQSGLTAETFTKSLGKLEKQIGLLKSGQGTLILTLKKTHPELLKQLMHAKNTSEAFNILVKGLRSMKDSTEQAALATAAMGNKGLKMIVMAKTSAKGLKALREEARKNGIITQKQATAAEAFNDQLNSLTHTIQGIIQSALLPLMPLLKEYLVIIQKWIIANKKLLLSHIKTFVLGLAKTLKFLVKHGKMIAIVTGSIIGLIVVLRTFILVMTAVNLIMELNPLGMIVFDIAAAIAGVIALIAILQKLRAEFKRKPGQRGFVTMEDPGGLKSKTPGFFASLFGHKQQNQPASSTVASVVSPAQKTAMAIHENRTTTTNKAEITIKDQTNTATVTHGALGNNVNLVKSGAF